MSYLAISSAVFSQTLPKPYMAVLLKMTLSIVYLYSVDKFLAPDLSDFFQKNYLTLSKQPRHQASIH